MSHTSFSQYQVVSQSCPVTPLQRFYIPHTQVIPAENMTVHPNAMASVPIQNSYQSMSLAVLPTSPVTIRPRSAAHMQSPRHFLVNASVRTHGTTYQQENLNSYAAMSGGYVVSPRMIQNVPSIQTAQHNNIMQPHLVYQIPEYVSPHQFPSMNYVINSTPIVETHDVFTQTEPERIKMSKIKTILSKSESSRQTPSPQPTNDTNFSSTPNELTAISDSPSVNASLFELPDENTEEYLSMPNLRDESELLKDSDSHLPGTPSSQDFSKDDQSHHLSTACTMVAAHSSTTFSSTISPAENPPVVSSSSIWCPENSSSSTSLADGPKSVESSAVPSSSTEAMDVVDEDIETLKSDLVEFTSSKKTRFSPLNFGRSKQMVFADQPKLKEIESLKDKYLQKAIVKPQMSMQCTMGSPIKKSNLPKSPANGQDVLQSSRESSVGDENSIEYAEIVKRVMPLKIKVHRGRGRPPKRKKDQWKKKVHLEVVSLPGCSTSSSEDNRCHLGGREESPSPVQGMYNTFLADVLMPESISTKNSSAKTFDVCGQEKPPSMWSVSEVYNFMSTFPGCLEYADTFKSQEIDGPALLLTGLDHLIRSMGMKLGHALKLQEYIHLLNGKPQED